MGANKGDAMGANKGDVPNCCRKMPSLRRAGLPGSFNLPKQLRMSPLPIPLPTPISGTLMQESRLSVPDTFLLTPFSHVRRRDDPAIDHQRRGRIVVERGDPEDSCHGPSTRSRGRLSEDRGRSESEGKSTLSIISGALQIIMIESFSGDDVARRLCRCPRYGGFAPGY